MGNRSTIAILETDGKVESIFTYWNGFVSGNGALLYQYHNSCHLAKDLISLGHIFQLTNIIEPPLGVEHTFDIPFPGISVFYARDGKRQVEIDKFKSLEEYINSDNLQSDNYIYYEKKKEWYCIDSNTKKLEKLTKFLLKDEEVDDFIKKMITSEKLKNKLEKKLIDKQDNFKIKSNKI